MNINISVIVWFNVNDEMPPQGTRVLYRDGVVVGEGYTNCKDIWFRHEGYTLDIMQVYPTHWAYLPRYKD